MDTFPFSKLRWNFLTRRIYWLFLAVGGVWTILGNAFSQELNSYKTVNSGNFPDVTIWEIWDGSAWNPAVTKPGQTNDIYIDQTHTLILIGNEAVKSVFLNAEINASEKLNLNGFNLDVYGSLHAFSGAAPGIPANAWNSINWIGNSVSSTLTFKGSSRVLIEKNSWSGQTTRSQFSVIFEADPGETFTLEAPFKTLSFTIRSGALHQKVDTSVIPNTCFTLSFNTETMVFGAGPFGSLVIESGATLLSECNSNILNRSTSGTISALNLNLQDGGTLILEGDAPRIEAANFQLDGKLIFRGETGPKTFLANSYVDAGVPNIIHDLELQGSQNLLLPAQLTLSGDLERNGTGNFVTGNTSLILAGNSDQNVVNFPLVVQDLELNKSGGNFYPNANLTIQRNLTLSQGSMDLEGNEMAINTGMGGSLSYSGGSWRNVGQFHYLSLPAALTPENSTFPFEDTKNGGIRKVQLLGNSAGGNLTISFTEYEGAEYNAGFFDIGGIEILYRLFSYFSFSGLTPSSNPLELRISADQLIVDDEDDLRIVGTGYAAPGSHLPGLDPVELWARRELTFGDLANTNFTVGSFRTLSVLPMVWLNINSQLTSEGVLVNWEILQENDCLFYEVYRNSDPSKLDWEKIGVVSPTGDTAELRNYQFLDTEATTADINYYRIRQVNRSTINHWSEVCKVLVSDVPIQRDLIIYPNPYSSGALNMALPLDFEWEKSELTIQNSQGKIVYENRCAGTDLAHLVQNLAPGLYHVRLISKDRVLGGKVIKK